MKNSDDLYAQLHFVALGYIAITLLFSLKDALLITALFTKAALSVENPSRDLHGL